MLFFMVTEKVIIGTPDCIEESGRTVDMTAMQLANDYDTQAKARMATIAMESIWSKQASENERLDAIALYLTAFKTDAEEAKEVRDYIDSNGMLRILFF